MSMGLGRLMVVSRPLVAAAAGPLASDAFNRADNASSLGTADTGQAWTALAGTWGIDTNRAYSAGTTPADRQAVVESGAADVTVVADLAVYDTGAGNRGPGLVFRAVDANNYWIFAAESGGPRWALYKRVAGAYTLVGSFNETLGPGLMEVVCSGATITCKVDGVTKITATDTQFETATQHGLRDYRADVSASRFDNFKVEAEPAPLVQDMFDRADSTTSLGSADTGQTWTTVLGTMGIDANQAYGPTSNEEVLSQVESGASDVDIACNITLGSQKNNGVVFRYFLDGTTRTFLMARIGVDKVELYKNGGLYSLIAEVAMPNTSGQVYAFRVVASGSTIDVYVDGVKKITATDAFNSTRTRCGMYGLAGTARWNNFRVDTA